MVHIIQHSTDGFGHQLHGLFTCMMLQNIRGIEFACNNFLTKTFSFEHLTCDEEKQQCIDYLKEAVRLFKQHFQCDDICYEKIIHSHEIYKIPKTPLPDTVYSLDNVFFINVMKLSEDEKLHLKRNIEIIQKFFVNKYLPPNRLESNNIVFHIRMGDAMPSRRNSILKYNNSVLKLIDRLKNKYSDHTLYFHTDDNIDFIINHINDGMKYIIQNKDTNILNVLSDFIYSNIMVSANSSLSKVSLFIGRKECIVHDDNNHFVPGKTINISNYLN